MSVTKTDKEVRFIQTTSADYAAQTEIISDAIYFLTDTKEIYVGSTKYSQSVNLKNGTGTNSVMMMNARASGSDAFAEGIDTEASGDASHAEGFTTGAVGSGSHAEGIGTTAASDASHAEGGGTTASGPGSHAEGNITVASGDYSHAEGNETTASGADSHAEGRGTKASSDFQHVQGKHNIEDASSTYAHIIGNGTADDNRSNANTVDWSGNAWYAGDVYVGSTSGTNKDAGSKKLATEDYVNDTVTTSLENKLDKSGGTITGDLALNGNLNITSGNQVNGDLNFTGDINLVSNLTLENGCWITFKNRTGNGGVNMYQESPDDSTPKLSLYGAYADEAVILNGIATPTNDSEAANKAYVDSTLASGNVGSAAKLATARYIDGVEFDGSADVTRYAVCASASGTTTKIASITAGTFKLATGARVTVRFRYANTASSPTLNVGQTGAKPIYWHNSALHSSQYWSAYSILDFVYTGSVWELVGIAKDNNTTYPTATTSKEGLLPKLSGVSTEYLRGDGQWATVSSSSGGMTREFYTGKISVTSYTTSTDKSKIYTVTVEDDRGNHQTLIVDYKTVQFCKNSSGIYTQMFVVYTSGNVFAIRFLQCKFNSGGTITFSLTDSSIKIVQICGFY